MSRGGYRSNSGPAPDPQSGRSEKRGYTLRALPREGYTGPVPTFPLEPIVLFTEYWEGSTRNREKKKDRDDAATASFRDREAAVWAEAWTTPQAFAWSTEAWRWPIIAEYCRLKTVIELDPAASAAIVGQLHRYREQIGLTPTGMRENGWEIAKDTTVPTTPTVPADDSNPTPQRRLRALNTPNP